MASAISRRVLITGSRGFTGRELTRYLASRGWEVCGLDADESAGQQSKQSIDLCDTAAVIQRLKEVRPSHLIHLAAMSHVVGDPISFYRTNLLGTESLIEAITASDTCHGRVLIASSATVYGYTEKSPICESDPLNPVTHYGLSKASMEQLLRKWHPALPVVVVRPFNYTGPGQAETFLVPKIVRSFSRRESVLSLGNFNVARDFSDIRFVCEAYRRLLDAHELDHRVFNVCSGVATSIKTILKIMEEISGYRPRIEVTPSLIRRDEVQSLCGSNQRLFKSVGDIPAIPLRDTLFLMYERMLALKAVNECGPGG